MTALRSRAIASAALTAAFTIAATSSADAEFSREPPRGAVEDCSRISGFGQSLRDLTDPRNLVVGPLAVLRAGRVLPYAGSVDGNKVVVVVTGGHRVTVELSRRTRRDVGLVFGPYPDGEVTLREARRVVTFVACRRGEYPYRRPPDGWPVSGWVGFLLARSPRCVPLLIRVDDEPRPRRAVIRFGVDDCG